MGDKARAKQLAREAGVPVVPGVEGEDLDARGDPRVRRRARLPVVIKAVAGGGGKGMRVVRDAAELASALDAAARARRRRRSATDRVLVERYLERAAPHRGAGARRPHGTRAPRRARVLAAAPPPEGGRGGALARRRRRAARADGRGGGRARARVRLRGRGHGRVHRRPADAGDVLLPGDEHAAAGRAPGDRARLRRRPRRAAAAGRGGRAARLRQDDARAARPRGRGALYAEDPANGFLPASARSAATASRRACASTPASARAARSARTTTRCSPR